MQHRQKMRHIPWKNDRTAETGSLFDAQIWNLKQEQTDKRPEFTHIGNPSKLDRTASKRILRASRSDVVTRSIFHHSLESFFFLFTSFVCIVFRVSGSLACTLLLSRLMFQLWGRYTKWWMDGVREHSGPRMKQNRCHKPENTLCSITMLTSSSLLPPCR